MHLNRIGIAVRAIAAIATLVHATPARAQRTTPSTTRRPAASKVAPRVETSLPRRTGFTLGVYSFGAPGITLSGNDVDGTFKTTFGPGGGFSVGYGFNETFSGFASLDVAKQGATGDYGGNFGLSHLEIGARANLPLGDETNVPYVTASYGRRGLGARVSDAFSEQSYDVKLTGSMFGVGGGVEHVISPTLAVDGGVSLGFGRFTHAQIDGESGTFDVNGNTTIRLRIGMTWRPAPRRS